MKLASFVARLASGKIKSVGAESVVPLVDLARSVRNSGHWNGDAVTHGAVLNDWDHPPVMRFSVRAEVSAMGTPKKGKK